MQRQSITLFFTPRQFEWMMCKKRKEIKKVYGAEEEDTNIRPWL